MKKLLTILLLLFYLPAISGVAISLQQCCMEVTAVKIQFSAEQCNLSHNADKDCCNDIGQFYKIHNPQQVAVSNISFSAPVLSVPAFSRAFKLIFFAKEEGSSINSHFFHFPPPRTTQPLFVRKESFLI